MPGVREVSSLLGDLMLKGWTMLADSCDECSVPLMRDPATQLAHCVSCRKVLRDGQLVEDEQAVSMDGAATSNQTQASPAPAPPGRAGGSAAINRPMPNGAERVPDDVPMDAELTRMRQRLMAQSRQQEERQAESGDPAGVLADYLLQGWTMLETCCPRCNTPLMRTRTEPRQTRCVACDLPVMTAQEAAAANLAPSPQPGRAATPEGPGAAAGLPPAVAANSSRPSPLPPSAAPAASAAVPQLPLQQRQPLASPAPAHAASAPTQQLLAADEAAVLQSVRQLLTGRIAELQQLLAATPVTEMVRNRELLDLLTQHMDALCKAQAAT